MLHTLRTRAHDESGFTLIELLVVVIIIGILAAIALPTFLGQRIKAQDSSAKSAVRNAVSHVESCFADVPVAPADCGLANADVALALNSSAPGGSATVTASGSYVVTAISPSGNSFTITKSGSAFTRSCIAAGSSSGGCDGTTW